MMAAPPVSTPVVMTMKVDGVALAGIKLLLAAAMHGVIGGVGIR